ncbi:major facilitator superfamily domain-containing protein [Flagelloscypha sp. PMI_526]|nr:major facilitator superfamily domain-containing protein [Flagelloscypha sp. PMI_526]
MPSSHLDVPEQPQRSATRSALIALTCTGTLITQLFGSTSISVSLPSIGRDFNVPENQLQWLVSAYALSSGCLLLFFGRIADLYGRKKVFVAGMGWSAVFSLGCGFAHGYLTLAILISMLGLGLAAAMPAALGILAASFHENTRSRSVAFATFSAGAPLGSALGGVIGGVLIETTKSTWKSAFYFTSGVIVIILIAGQIYFENDPVITEEQRVDWLGAFLITAGLVLIVFVLGQGELADQKWKTPYIIALLILGVFLVIGFGFWESYLERHTEQRSPASKPPIEPLMKMSLFSRGGRRYAITMCITFLEYTCFMSWYFWMQIYYQNFLSLTPLHTAIRLLAMPATGLLINVVTALVVGRVPMVVLISLGTALTSTAAILYATMDPYGSYWRYQFPALVVSVTGADFVYGVGTLYVAKLSEGKEQSVTGGFFQTMTQMGAAFGVTITTVVFNRVNGGQDTQFASLDAYKSAWWAATGFAALACILCLVFFWSVGIVGHGAVQETDRPSKLDAHANVEKPIQ